MAVAKLINSGRRRFLRLLGVGTTIAGGCGVAHGIVSTTREPRRPAGPHQPKPGTVVYMRVMSMDTGADGSELLFCFVSDEGSLVPFFQHDMYFATEDMHAARVALEAARKGNSA